MLAAREYLIAIGVTSYGTLGTCLPPGACNLAIFIYIYPTAVGTVGDCREHDTLPIEPQIQSVKCKFL